jgi:hypothetical protein
MDDSAQIQQRITDPLLLQSTLEKGSPGIAIGLALTSEAHPMRAPSAFLYGRGRCRAGRTPHAVVGAPTDTI